MIGSEQCHSHEPCFARGSNGGCRALSKTYPEGVPCPFRKLNAEDPPTKAMVERLKEQLMRHSGRMIIR